MPTSKPQNRRSSRRRPTHLTITPDTANPQFGDASADASGASRDAHIARSELPGGLSGAATTGCRPDMASAIGSAVLRYLGRARLPFVESCVMCAEAAGVGAPLAYSDDVVSVFTSVRDVARAVQWAFGADGTTIRQNNNPPGQEIDHLHFHIVARFVGDDFWNAEAHEVEMETRRRQAEALRSALTESRSTNSDT